MWNKNHTHYSEESTKKVQKREEEPSRSRIKKLEKRKGNAAGLVPNEKKGETLREGKQSPSMKGWEVNREQKRKKRKKAIGKS